LNQAILYPTEFQGHQLVVGAAIGTATYPQDGETADALINAADAKMYLEKKSQINAE
jgi:GGDEF domain-containing protein